MAVFQKVFLGADHRGFAQKEKLKSLLASQYEVVDCGPSTVDPDDDYNTAARAVAVAVSADKNAAGILICGSSHGMAIQANRFRKIRAISGFSPELAKLGRQHNDANILCLGADFVNASSASQIVENFLTTEFLAEPRLLRRNQILEQEVE